MPWVKTIFSTNTLVTAIFIHILRIFLEKDWDLGDKTLNCGRRVDAFKLWFAWKAVGDEVIYFRGFSKVFQGFENVVNHAFDQAAYITQEIKKRPEKFLLVKENPQSLNVCFWYIPPSARSMPAGPEKDKKLDEAVLTIRRRMQLEGKVLYNYSDLPGLAPHFFRLITCNPGAGKKDMDFLLEETDRLGADL